MGFEGEVERVSGVHKDEFLARYIETSTPVVVCDLVPRWPAHRLWEPEYLIAGIGDAEVPLIEFDPQTRRQLAIHRIAFSAFAASFFKSRFGLPSFYMRQTLVPKNLKADLEYPDFVNPAVASQPNLWLGGRGSYTPLHYDGLHNVLAQLRGRKRLLLFHPDDRPHLYYDPPMPFEPVQSRVDMQNPDLEAFPALAKTRAVEVTLEAGEALFLPACWGHYVEGLDRNISVNIWWKPRLSEALALELTEPVDFDDLLGSPLRSLAEFFDVTSLDEFQIADALFESGRKERGARAVVALAHQLVALAQEKWQAGAAFRFPERRPIDREAALAALAAGTWKPDVTRVEPAKMLEAWQKLHEAGVISQTERGLLAELSLEPSRDGANALEVNRLLKQVATTLELLPGFAPHPPSSFYTDGIARRAASSAVAAQREAQ